MEGRRKPCRGDIYSVNLAPAIGTEVRKTRPAVILSNNAQNEVGQRVLAAPLTSNTSRVYSFEALIQVEGKPGKAMLDQVRCLDQSRLGSHIGSLTSTEMKALERALQVAFDLT